jgi:hypothetical protein
MCPNCKCKTLDPPCEVCNGTGFGPAPKRAAVVPLHLFAFTDTPVVIGWINRKGEVQKEQTVTFDQE